MREELLYSMGTGVYHVGFRVGHTPKDGGYLDAYEAHCGESYEVWRGPRKVRVGSVRKVDALPWEENHYVPRFDGLPVNLHVCESCKAA
jgi:hypothetical protein